jgi:hypothetical protein
MAIIRPRHRIYEAIIAIGDVSEEKSADYDGNDRATPLSRDLVRPSLAKFYA